MPVRKLIHYVFIDSTRSSTSRADVGRAMRHKHALQLNVATGVGAGASAGSYMMRLPVTA